MSQPSLSDLNGLPSITPLSDCLDSQIAHAIDSKTKPPGSPGRIELLAAQLARVQQTLTPVVNTCSLTIFAADHGIAKAGVSAFPQEVLRQMVLNFLAGGAAANVFAGTQGIEVRVVDAGLAGEPLSHDRLISRHIAPGTGSFLDGPAMTRDQLSSCLEHGAQLGKSAPGEAVAFGEMGIANTSSAAMLAHKLTGQPVQFMTRLPGLSRAGWTRERERASVGYYPATGIVVGVIAALAYWLSSLWFPPLLSSLLAVAAAILISGALHEDGLADVCDGVGGGQTRDKALAIMKDSHIGAYGTLGLMLFVGAKVITLSGLPADMAMAALVGGHAISRAAILATLATADYARTEGGTASAVAERPSPESWTVAGLTLALVVVLCLLITPFGAIVYAVAGAAVLALVMRQVFMRKLGGYTGDCLGAVQQAGELGFCLGLAAWA